MNHTPQIKKAIQFAARKHHGQMRMEREPLPYITHLFSVALLVAETIADDDVVTAALLHDTLEDTSTTTDELAIQFNMHVAELVDAVSEKGDLDGRTLEWKERKELYLKRLESADTDALCIAIADKIDNLESWREALQHEGSSLLSRSPQPLSEYQWYHSEVLRIARARLPEHPLTRRLSEVHAKEKGAFVV